MTQHQIEVKVAILDSDGTGRVVALNAPIEWSDGDLVVGVRRVMIIDLDTAPEADDNA